MYILTNIIAGILTGYIVSMPPMGPISFAMISRGFKNEIKEGRAIAFGAAFMDFLFCLIAFGGITLIFSIFPVSVSDFFEANADTIETILTFAGCAITVAYGIKIIRTKITYDKLAEKESGKLNIAEQKAEKLKEKSKVISKNIKVYENKFSDYMGLFFMGVLLCLSSVTLPASWIALIGYLRGFSFLNFSFLGGLLFSVGAFVGTLGWFYTLLKLISGNKKLINHSTINILNLITGIILLTLGLFLFVKAFISVLN